MVVVRVVSKDLNVIEYTVGSNAVVLFVVIVMAALEVVVIAGSCW